MDHSSRSTTADLFNDVGDFNRKFGLPHYGEEQNPHLLDASAQEFRVKFMQEELDEFCEAYANQDLAKAADALCDLVYVALGTAHFMHVPFFRCWAEVQRANMQKERASSSSDARSVRNHSLDVVKPAGWAPPNIEDALKEHDQ